MTQAERVKSAAIKLLRNEMEALRFRAVSKFAVYLGVGEKTLRRVFGGHTSLEQGAGNAREVRRAGNPTGAQRKSINDV
jgi:hypothetical protein